MGVPIKVLGISLFAIIALSIPETAWGQEPSPPPPPSAPLDKAWQGVVGATFAHIEQLPQAAAPSVLSATPPRRIPPLFAPPPPAEVPEAGPTFRLGPFRLTLAPVVVESPVVANVRAPVAQLLGVTLRMR